ncbi:hypothetical protein K438DRAFT_1634240 [Mycena galopus ATCC 62051]|nr:hypothetical protein K438DRAFT_1634240 [Mycena galopus ATCC 62051]
MGLPILSSENPHTQMTRSGPAPEILPDDTQLVIPFTNTVFPHISVPYSVLTQNMLDDVIDSLDDKELAIVPFGTGADFYKDNPHTNQEVTKFLHSLLYDTTTIRVSMLMAKSKPKCSFNRPWPIILTGAGDDLAEFLCWNQTFSIHDKLTFNVVPFDRTIESWVVMIIDSDTVSKEKCAMAKVLHAIKYRLWNDSTFLNFVNRVLGAAGVPGSGRQQVIEATKTFNLTYIETDDMNSNKALVYQLTAKPITSDPKDHRLWLSVIRSMRGGYRVGYDTLCIDNHWVNCTWCKLQMHLGHNCPFPLVDGWLGIKPDNTTRHATRIQKEMDREEGSSKGKGKDKSDGCPSGRWSQAGASKHGHKWY